jgi:DNA-binding transcriptional regulator YiaG
MIGDYRIYTLRNFSRDDIMLAEAIIGGMTMECKDKIKELRESTGMNRKEFCTYFKIPYRTVTEWELGNRHAPEYVIWLLEYYIRNELLKDE